jgi:hypothetical protein
MEYEELPPLHALDKAANLAGWDCWAAVSEVFARDSIIAHARTLAKYEPAPDPDKREREECAHMLAQGGFGAANVNQGIVDAYKAILKERGL